MTRNSDHKAIFYIGSNVRTPHTRRTKHMKKITVARITDKATFPGVQIQHIEEVKLENVFGLVFVKDDPFSDNPIPSVDVIMADDTERRFHSEDIAFIAFEL